MEPLFLYPVFKDYIWGGNKLKKVFNKDIPNDFAAESWEVSTNEDGKSIILNEEFKGKTLQEIFNNKEYRKSIFGTKSENLDRFPLLIKFIDANNNLSIQVHPDNDYAKNKENDIGKTEMWYIIDCEPGAQVICGFKEDVTQNDIEEIIRQNKTKDNVKFIDVDKGDAIYIPSGTVHALLGKTLLCEVQQNSNLTYRVYDWDRLDKDGNPRQLHIQKAIDVINVSNKPTIIKTINEKQNECRVADSEFFKTDKIIIDEKFEDISKNETFYAINIISGEGILICNEKEYKIKKGDSFIIPATLGKYEIIGKMELLKSYI